MKNKIGKNFSCNNTGKRHKSDFYQTPYSITEQLLENEKFDYNKTVLDPACGKLAIVKIIDKYFKYHWFSDINLQSYCDKHKSNMLYNVNGWDFLKEENKFNYIITNPPFSLAFEFIQKAKEVAREKFAMLLPLNYLHGQKRYDQKIFRDENYPLTKVYVFTRYPLLEESIRDDGKYKTGMMVYAWFIWEKKNGCGYQLYDSRTVIKWIDNNKYVLSNKKYSMNDNQIEQEEACLFS